MRQRSGKEQRRRGGGGGGGGGGGLRRLTGSVHALIVHGSAESAVRLMTAPQITHEHWTFSRRYSLLHDT